MKQGRKKVMVSDLPFPGGRATQIWRKLFVPSLISWAGSQSDPFGTNSKVENVAAEIWKRVLPAISLDQETREVLMGVVRAIVSLAVYY